MLYLLICSFTIFIASRADLMYENITGVSTLPQYHLLVIIYTFFCAMIFGYKTKKVFQCLTHYQPFCLITIYLSSLLMVIGSLFIYTTNGQDLSSKIHVYCSMLPSLFFIILLFIYNRYLLSQFPEIYQRIHWYFESGVSFLGILLVVFTRVNGYIEILFAILMSSYLFIIEKQFQKISVQKSSSQ